MANINWLWRRLKYQTPMREIMVFQSAHAERNMPKRFIAAFISEVTSCQRSGNIFFAMLYLQSVAKWILN